MQDIAQAKRYLTKTLREFEYQAVVVYEGIVKLRWDQSPWRNRLPHILYGWKYLADLGGNKELQVKFRRAEKQLSSAAPFQILQQMEENP